MELEPWKWFLRLKLSFLRYLPLEPRKKAKRYLQYADLFSARGEQGLAQLYYDTSRGLAQRAGAVHLLKKLDKRSSPQI